VIDEQSPAGGTLDPDAENVDFVAAGHYGADLAVGALAHFSASFAAERGGRDGTEDLRSCAASAICVRPREIRVEEFGDCRFVGFRSGLDKVVIGLKNFLILTGCSSRLVGDYDQQANEEDADHSCTCRDAIHRFSFSQEFLPVFIHEKGPDKCPALFRVPSAQGG
jgi:hypothetical protein